MAASGQPPIHPRVMAGVILYGLMRRIRSSRQLEYACGNNIDFMWLAEGRGDRPRYDLQIPHASSRSR